MSVENILLYLDLMLQTLLVKYFQSARIWVFIISESQFGSISVDIEWKTANVFMVKSKEIYYFT